MSTTSIDIRCLHCGSTLPEREITDGWCDSCGKRLPTWFGAELKRNSPSAPPRGEAATVASQRTQEMIWGAAFFALAAAVAALVLARGG
jgi:hypothetical protein